MMPMPSSERTHLPARVRLRVSMSGVPRCTIVVSPEHPMLPYLVDLDSRFEAAGPRDYDPVELVRYALSASDYWADLGIRWLEEGVPARSCWRNFEWWSGSNIVRSGSGTERVG
jgi:hypothetical protein